MASHHHGTRKTATATTDKLPDTSGNNITYAGGTQCEVETTFRQNSEPDVTAGAAGTSASYSGTVSRMQATHMPQYKLDGATVWELVTTLSVDGDTA